MENNGNAPACASCKHQRKKCDRDCVMAPYFPYSRLDDFNAVQKVFGVSNTSKMLCEVDTERDRFMVAESLIWEGRCRREDKVYGAMRQFRKLQSRCNELEAEIKILKERYKQLQELFCYCNNLRNPMQPHPQTIMSQRATVEVKPSPGAARISQWLGSNNGNGSLILRQQQLAGNGYGMDNGNGRTNFDGRSNLRDRDVATNITNNGANLTGRLISEGTGRVIPPMSNVTNFVQLINGGNSTMTIPSQYGSTYNNGHSNPSHISSVPVANGQNGEANRDNNEIPLSMPVVSSHPQQIDSTMNGYNNHQQPFYGTYENLDGRQ